MKFLREAISLPYIFYAQFIIECFYEFSVYCLSFFFSKYLVRGIILLYTQDICALLLFVWAAPPQKQQASPEDAGIIADFEGTQ